MRLISLSACRLSTVICLGGLFLMNPLMTCAVFLASAEISFSCVSFLFVWGRG